ncbi:CMGC:MAPK:NMO protein kinase [Trichuris trichiura]|uniref:Mitogen-activated protein kinase n=1 Tax=Trichuris trichiura TaxID=36087 RepID=A0A077ZB67_TRITR|nr:CMGC:MAPK:NMO protein kinase [Trichuris trichiura]
MALVSHQRCLLAGVNDSNKSSLLATQSYFPGSVGQQMQNVQPDRPIGYGAFGVVWSVTDPRSGKKVALKRMPNVFLNLASCKRVFREIRMLCSFKNDNVLSCLDILHPPNARLFVEIYVLTELMQSDLHKIIVSPQPLTADHVKVFIYQILRGVKYLHSANILHRDIKPGNLLVNSNCLLKICDFGLARIWDPSEQGHLTHEVVTQYYRAPELLMGARKYTAAVDVWSIGCIFAELLGRRILFQAQGPVEQLNLIIDLLGTPTVTEMKYACEGARSHVLKSPFRSPKLFKLYSLSPHATQEAVDLLAQMLCFDPDQRVGVENALGHPYLEEGRLRFHSCMCSCCRTTASGQRAYAQELEPRHSEAFDVEWEKELSRLSMFDLRDRIYKFIVERTPPYHIPLCINPDSAAFKSFITSSVAQPSELPPSPHAWD